MLIRSITPPLQRLAASFPVLAITGPRQSGKTTLVRRAELRKQVENRQMLRSTVKKGQN